MSSPEPVYQSDREAARAAKLAVELHAAMSAEERLEFLAHLRARAGEFSREDLVEIALGLYQVCCVMTRGVLSTERAIEYVNPLKTRAKTDELLRTFGAIVRDRVFTCFGCSASIKVGYSWRGLCAACAEQFLNPEHPGYPGDRGPIKGGAA